MHSHSTCINFNFFNYTLEVELNKNLIDIFILVSLSLMIIINFPENYFYSLEYPVIDGSASQSRSKSTVLALSRLKVNKAKIPHVEIVHPSHFKVDNLSHTLDKNIMEVKFNLTKAKQSSYRYHGSIDVDKRALSKTNAILLQSSPSNFSFKNLRRSYYKFDLSNAHYLNKPIILNINEKKK